MVQVADLTEVGQKALVAKGGRGGRGNARFVSSTNRAPRRSDPGDEGDIVKLHLRLKLLADVGLIGFPNAGKSTLIARISAAKPKIADYPFTTLTPNLGVVSLDDDRSFVVADVPGLIEGAHEGHGLGHRFLGHVERTKVLLHLVDVSSGSGRDPVEDFEIIRRELALYTPPNETHADRVSLADRPQIVVANKIDALDDPDRLARLKARAAELGLAFHAISGAAGDGHRRAARRDVAIRRRRPRAGASTAGRDGSIAASMLQTRRRRRRRRRRDDGTRRRLNGRRPGRPIAR